MTPEIQAFIEKLDHCLSQQQDLNTIHAARLAEVSARVDALERVIRVIGKRAGLDEDSLLAAYENVFHQLHIQRFNREVPNCPAKFLHLGPKQPPIEQGAPAAVI